MAWIRIGGVRYVNTDYIGAVTVNGDGSLHVFMVERFQDQAGFGSRVATGDAEELLAWLKGACDPSAK